MGKWAQPSFKVHMHGDEESVILSEANFDSICICCANVCHGCRICCDISLDIAIFTNISR